MKAAFLVHRKDFYKYMGPLIQAALARGWQCEAWLYAGEESKEYLALKDQPLPTRFAGTVKLEWFQQDRDVPSLAQRSAPDVVFSLHPRSRYGDAAWSTCFVTLHHGVDTFLRVSPENLLSSDWVCLQTPFWLQWGSEYFAAQGLGSAAEIRQKLETKVSYTGTPRLDIATQMDAELIRQKYGIVDDKPVVLYFPINVAYWPGHWPAFFVSKGTERLKAFGRGLRDEGVGFLKYLPWLLFGWNDEALTRAVRRFCDKNNAFLVVKGRRKDPLRPASQDMADLAIYDEEFYPATIYELMSVAEVCIHSYSSAAFEMTVFDVFGICVDRPNLDDLSHKLWRTAHQGSVFNFEGVNQWTSIPQMIHGFGAKSLVDLRADAKSLKDYVRTYVDPGDGSSSERILDRAAAWAAQKRANPVVG
ncbi:MAG: hypothetical protein KIS80_01210 [Anaerolineales bacterium]|nr:hypothetical protein [Anaerolineales bacterium]